MWAGWVTQHTLAHTTYIPVFPSVSTAPTDDSKLTSSRMASALQGEGGRGEWRGWPALIVTQHAHPRRPG